MGSSNFTCEDRPKRIEMRDSNGYLCISPSANGWTDFLNVAYACNGILLSCQKEWNFNPCDNVGESAKHYAKWNEPDTKRQILYVYMKYQVFRIGKFTETKRRCHKRLEHEKRRVTVLWVQSFYSGWEQILKTDRSEWLAKNVTVLNATKLHT